MKSLMVAGIFLVVACNAFAGEGDLNLSCRIKNIDINSEEASLTLSCDDTDSDFSFVGENDSPCKAATHLAKFLKGAKVGEKIEVVTQGFDHSSQGGSEFRIEVMHASRANSDKDLTIPTVTNHGKAELCNSTQVEFLGTTKE